MFRREYHTMYSCVSPDVLRLRTEGSPEKTQVESWFEVCEIINSRPEKKCISVCLFRQNVDNKTPNEHTVDQERWRNKYYNNLLRLLRDFHNSAQLSDWKIRLYLEAQFRDCAAQFLEITDKLECFVMQHNSIGAQPGMLWRFLAFDDRNLEIAFAVDIDDELSGKYDKIRAFEHSNATLGRYISNSKDDYRIDKGDPNSVWNYATVIGSMVGFRPSAPYAAEFSVRETIVNYILYRMSRAAHAARPWLEFDDAAAETDKYNRPIGNHTLGWGGHWTMYGFDERYLKTVLFPYFVGAGAVLTWTYENIDTYMNLPHEHPCRIDYEYCASYNNPFVRL